MLICQPELECDSYLVLETEFSIPDKSVNHILANTAEPVEMKEGEREMEPHRKCA